MSKARIQIRKKAKEILLGKTAAKQKVYINRADLHEYESLPVIVIYTRTENLEERTQAPREMWRLLNLQIEAIVEGQDGEDISNKLDLLLEEIETEISKDDTLRCTVDDIVLQSVNLDFEDGAEKIVAAGTLNWLVKYRDSFPRTQIGLPDLNAIGADYRIGHNDGEPNMSINDSAKDEVIVNP